MTWTRRHRAPVSALTMWSEHAQKANWPRLESSIWGLTNFILKRGNRWISGLFLLAILSTPTSLPFPTIRVHQEEQRTAALYTSPCWRTKWTMTPQEAKNCCVTFFPSPTTLAPAACISSMNWRAIPVTFKLKSPPACWWKARTSALMIWEMMTSLRTAPQWNWKQKSSGHRSVRLRRTVTLTALPLSQKNSPLSPLCLHRGIPAGWFIGEPPTFKPSRVRWWPFCFPCLCAVCLFLHPVTLL